MSRRLRREEFDPSEICIVHTVQRCVRRAFLAGQDVVTGNNYDYRREWIRRRLEQLASVFGIDVLSYAILSNHLHLVVRTRPDVVRQWSDRQVSERWLRLFPGRRLEEYLGAPVEEEIEALSVDRRRLEQIRVRLSDVSWFMRSLSEPIARMANRQDGCTGRFWEGRFKAQRIADEAGLLACSLYVDLNPIRAALAATPEESHHTSAYDRIGGLLGEELDSAAFSGEVLKRQEAAARIQRGERGRLTRGADRVAVRRIRRDDWLSPLQLGSSGSLDPELSRTGVRASDKGFLEMSVEEYLSLLDWAGREGRAGKRGTIPAGMEGILSRLGIEGRMFCDLVWNFKRYFGRSVGRPGSLAAEASRRGRSWYWGQRAASGCFSTV